MSTMFSFSSLTGNNIRASKKDSSSKEASTSTASYQDTGAQPSSNDYRESHGSHGGHGEEFRAKRSRGGSGRGSGENQPTDRASRERMDPRQVRLTEEEYELIARDIMSKPPFSGYLKYHLPLKYAARTEEVKWEWIEEGTGMLVHRELIGGGKNSDLDY